MVCRVEVLVGQVVVVAGRSVGQFDGGDVRIEFRVSLEGAVGRALHGVQASQLLGPATEGVAVLNRYLVGADGELSGLQVLLDGLCAEYGRAVGIHEGQRVKWLAYERSHPVHRHIVVGHGDGDDGLLVIALVCDVAQLAFLHLYGDGILLVDHLVGREEFDGGHVVIALDLKGLLHVVGDAVGCHGGQHGDLLLRTVQQTLDDDAAEAHLLILEHAVEVQQQTALALAGSSVGDGVTEL